MGAASIRSALLLNVPLELWSAEEAQCTKVGKTNGTYTAQSKTRRLDDIFTSPLHYLFQTKRSGAAEILMGRVIDIVNGLTLDLPSCAIMTRIN